MEQAGESGGPDANRYLPALAKNRGRQLLLRDIHHDALAQLHRAEVRQIAIERDLVVRTAVRVVENGFRHARLREDRRHVRRETTLERLGGHEYIVAESEFVQRLSFDDQSLGVGAL